MECVRTSTFHLVSYDHSERYWGFKKRWNAPSALNTPSPNNDLNWECNIGPKDIIHQQFFCHMAYMPPTLVKGIKLGGKNRLEKRTVLITNIKTTWHKYLDMVRLDREQLQAIFLKNAPLWTRCKHTYSSISEESYLVYISVLFRQCENEVGFQRKLLVFGYECGSIMINAPGYPLVTLSVILAITANAERCT